MNEDDKKCLRDNIRLAEQLGAQTETVHSEEVPYQIAGFARFSGVLKLTILVVPVMNS